jgi:predicted MFS family arabinose efflux permease
MIPSVLILFLLSRWAGGLADRIGAKRLLIVGPAIAAAGFELFAQASHASSYWTGFFPAFVVLGFGMALTVAPLTTTVMASVAREHSGVASGINNAVSEGAGLLAVAVLGLAMSHAFDAGLERRLQRAQMKPEVREEIRRQESKLAAIEIPGAAGAGERAAARSAVDESFIAGFRLVMAIATGLALMAALCAWIILPAERRSRAPPAD